LTAADGSYVLEGIQPGRYLLSFSYVGYRKKWSPVFDLQAGAIQHMEDLALSVSTDLQQVTVEAIQPLFSQKPGMLVMNLENSAVKMSGTVFEALAKAPGVMIDPDGNISMKGKAGVQIYLDGKPTYLSADQLKEYLMTLPAADILRIELMTTPPAKYNAEGSAGIINIVTRKKQQSGLNGTVSAGIGRGNTTREETGLNLSYGSKKISAFARYDYSNYYRQETKVVFRSVASGAHATTFDQHVDLGFRPVAQTLKTGLDWFATNKLTLGLRLDGASTDRNSLLDSRTTITKTDSGTASILHQINKTAGTYQNGSVNGFLNQKLDTLGSELNVSADLLHYQNRSAENYDLHYLNLGGAEMSPATHQKSFPSSDISIYVAQVDYTKVFPKKYRFEGGLKSSYVKSNNELLFQTQVANGQWQTDAGRSNSFIYSENINAAYIDGTAEYGKLQVRAGLRAEQTVSDGLSPTTSQDHANNYIQLFPTLFVSKTLSENHSLQASFFRRINRPAYDELNPFIFYVDQYLRRIGNPFLQPEISNGGDLSYSYKNTIYASVGASRTTFGIAHVTRLVDSTGVLSQLSVNMNTIDNGYLSLTWASSPYKWWNSSLNMTLNYNHYLANLSGQTLDRGNLTYNFNLTESFLLKKGIKLELSGWYQSQTVYSIFLIQPAGDVSLGLSKAFFADKLKCSLSVSDLFLTRAQHVVVNFQDQQLTTTYNFDSRYLYLRLRYSFGGTGSGKKGSFKNVADDLQKRVG
jgi:iron complex outermembrane receptor protein